MRGFPTNKELLIALLLLIVSSATSARVYEHEVPDEITIAFSGNSYKKYLNLLDGAKNSRSLNIGEEFKRNLKIFGTYFNRHGQEQLFSGQARITGDLKDHLEEKKRISSLSISLKHGNVGGVVKFRLLIPDTRGGENEVFWSLLMEELGYPVPYRRLIHVNLMGSDHAFLFEEKPEKEFLESNGFREGPILEYDERQAWANLGMGSWGKWLDQLKIKNSDFLKNKTSYEIAYRSLKPDFSRGRIFELFDEVNRKFAPHGLIDHNRKYLYDVIYNDYLPVYFDGDVFDGLDSICEEQNSTGQFFTEARGVLAKIKILEAKYRDRALGKEFSDDYRCVAKYVFRFFEGNEIRLREIRPLTSVRRYIETAGFESMLLREQGFRHRPPKYHYNVTSGDMTECFYLDPSAEGYLDRYPDLGSAYSTDNKGKTRLEWGEQHYREFGNLEGREFFDPTKTDRLFAHYVDRYPGLGSVYQRSPGGTTKAQWGRRHYQDYGLSEGRLVYQSDPGNEKEQAIERMLREDDLQSIWGNCRQVSEKKVKEIFSGEEKPIKMGDVSYFGFFNIEYIPQVRESFRELELDDTTLELEVDSGIEYVELTGKNSTINIYLLSEDAHLVLYNSDIRGSTINIIGAGSNNGYQDARFNNKLLTSCFTLIDSEVYGSTFTAENCSREDALNFIRVDGAQIRIEVSDSAHDALDSDFSNLHFDSIQIDNAGNDCVDLSAGVYNIHRIYLSNCGDKAISVGERSYASLRNINIVGAKVGIASKDLSRVFLGGTVSIQATGECFLAYQKKQEFGPGYIHAEKQVPECSFGTLNRGFYDFGDTCEFVDRTYFFNLCASEHQLSITLNSPLPQDHLLIVERRQGADQVWMEVQNETLRNVLARCKVGKVCQSHLPLDSKDLTYRVGIRDQSSGAKAFLREIN